MNRTLTKEVETEAENVYSEGSWKETDACRILELLIMTEMKKKSQQISAK